MDYNEFNFKLEQLKTNLYKILEQSQLPLGAILYILKDILNNLNDQYIASINNYGLSHPSGEKTIELSDPEEEIKN